MTPQAIPPYRQGPQARRWLVFAVLALALGAWLLLDLLPRVGGSFQGTNWGKREPGFDWGDVEVVWDPTDPRAGTRATQAPPTPAAEPEPAPTPAAPSRALPGATRAAETPPPATSGTPGGAAGPEPAPGGGAPRVGQGEATRAAGRDSPRILQAAWPSRHLLAELEASGRLRYRLRVEADGRVSIWELLDDGGFDCPACRGEAERIIRDLRFAPGTLDGRPVACWVPYEISFEKGGR
jgi:hypothetical protein